ncbi:MAG: hypothetical protein SCH71_17375 [Desulfobulbaceae bacterium]|nr:hypothetical protein [Desulfobulbaceae bacterium]
MSINTDCSFTGVSIFGVKFSGTITRKINNSYSGAGQTDANGCGSFTITCTNDASFLSCNYDYNNGGSGTIQNASEDQCMPANRFLTRSLAGSWSFTYEIISIFTDYYNLDINEVYEEPAGSGEYYIYDTNYYYGAGYDPGDNIYFLYDPGYPFDIFYSFTYTSTNQVAGCYYQYYYDTDTLSDCYPMSGERTSSGF